MLFEHFSTLFFNTIKLHTSPYTINKSSHQNSPPNTNYITSIKTIMSESTMSSAGAKSVMSEDMQNINESPEDISNQASGHKANLSNPSKHCCLLTHRGFSSASKACCRAPQYETLTRSHFQTPPKNPRRTAARSSRNSVERTLFTERRRTASNDLEATLKLEILCAVKLRSGRQMEATLHYQDALAMPCYPSTSRQI